jgi:multicomponent Na+:H+ antiporter subunit F
MTTILGAACLAFLAASALLLIRVAKGPTVCDRIVALNALSTQVTFVVLVYAAFADRSIYLDSALWLASFSYLGTIVWARYLERGLL